MFAAVLDADDYDGNIDAVKVAEWQLRTVPLEFRDEFYRLAVRMSSN